MLIWFSHLIFESKFFFSLLWFVTCSCYASRGFLIVWRLLSPTFCMVLASSYFLPHRLYLHVTSVVILKKFIPQEPGLLKQFLFTIMCTIYRRVIWAYFSYHEPLAISVIFQERSDRKRFSTITLGIAAYFII